MNIDRKLSVLPRSFLFRLLVTHLLKGKSIILVLSLLCFSCNSVKYYEYYVGGDSIIDFSSYCTLEITNKKIVYRSSTFNIPNSNKEWIPFLYIELDNKYEANTFKIGDFKKLIFYESILNIDDITDVKYSKCEFFQDSITSVDGSEWFGPLGEKDKNEFPGYYKKGNTYRLDREEKTDWEYQFENGFLNAVGLWFPKELKRTRKIDYSKFSVDKDLIDTVADSIKNSRVNRVDTFKSLRL